MCSPDTVRMDMQMFTKALKEERTKQVGDIVYRASFLMLKPSTDSWEL